MGDVTEGISELEQIDLKSIDAVYNIEVIISKKFEKLPSFRCDLALNTFIVRARYLPPDTEPFYKINELSFNPIKENIKIGRANYQNQQVFYGATNGITALTEINIINEESEANYVLSQWEIIKPLELIIIVNPATVENNKALGLLGISEFIIKNSADFKDNSEIGEFLELYKYISSKFVEKIKIGEEHKYKITAAFSNFIYNNLPCDGILYQSVKNPKEFNIALKNEVIHEKVRLSSANFQKLKRISTNEFQFFELARSKKVDYDSFKIEW